MVKKDIENLVKRVATEGYEKARERVPQFTDQLFLWAHSQGATEALSQFLAAFVDRAVILTMDYVTGEIAKNFRGNEQSN